MEQLYKHIASGEFVMARTSANDVGAMSFYPDGGGFERTLSTVQFNQEFEPSIRDLSLKQGIVGADFLDDKTFPCYTDGTLWNGFGVPLFELSVAKLVVQEANAGMPDDELVMVKFEGNDMMTLDDDTEGTYRLVEPEDHIVNGVEMRLYAVGDGWTWDRVEITPQA